MPQVYSQLIPQRSQLNIGSELRAYKQQELNQRQIQADIADKRAQLMQAAQRAEEAERARKQTLALRMADQARVVEQDRLKIQTLAEEDAYRSWLSVKDEPNPAVRQRRMLETAVYGLRPKYGPNVVTDDHLNVLSTPQGYAAFERDMRGRSLAAVSSATTGKSLDTGAKDARYYEDPQTGKQLVGFIDRNSGEVVSPGGQVLNTGSLKDITHQVNTQRAKTKIERDLAKTRAEEWIKDAGEKSEVLASSIKQKTLRRNDLLNAQETLIDSPLRTGAFAQVNAVVDALKGYAGIDIDPGSPKFTDEIIGGYRVLLAQPATEIIKGNTNEKEFKFITDSVIDLSKSPEGNQFLLEMGAFKNQWELEYDAREKELIDAGLSRAQVASGMKQFLKTYRVRDLRTGIPIVGAKPGDVYPPSMRARSAQIVKEAEAEWGDKRVSVWDLINSDWDIPEQPGDAGEESYDLQDYDQTGKRLEGYQ